MSAELMAEGQTLPEDLGEKCCSLLLEEIMRVCPLAMNASIIRIIFVSQGGCVDTANQSLLLTFMALGPEDLTRLRIGKLSEYTYVSLARICDWPSLSAHCWSSLGLPSCGISKISWASLSSSPPTRRQTRSWCKALAATCSTWPALPNKREEKSS